MLTSKRRAELRASSNSLDTTLIVGKEGVTDAIVSEADNQLAARELIKGKVLESALLSPREVCDTLCAALGADSVSVIGAKFVLYRFSEKCQAERNASGRAKRRQTPVSKSDPVRKGIRARRQKAKQEREERNAFFRQKAIDSAIEREREKKYRS